VYINAGGGHRSAALALDAVIREQGRPWEVRLVNLFEVFDPSGMFRKTTGMNPEDYYNKRLARGWTLGLAQELKLLQALIRLSHTTLTRQLRRHWRRTQPDLVVSLVPNFNRAMFQAAAAAVPAAPYVTVMTDFADLPPHFWMEPDQPQHLICGTPHAVAQARAMGWDETRLHSASGMILRPDFYRERQLDRAAEMRGLGLDPARPTGIVMFGGHGSRVMRSIARRLDDTQLILICGHNRALAARLGTQRASAPRVVVGFTPDIRYYMKLSDFFIGKPGPGSISEAVQQGLPVIVVRNALTMPQERYNADWILENHAGVVLDSFRAVKQGVASVTRRLGEFRASIARIDNRAVFEIPGMLDSILVRGRRAAWPTPATTAPPEVYGISVTARTTTSALSGRVKLLTVFATSSGNE
jgi:UDP-N-acetylglucosamine:LPS N-acetylglucosamine transferase